MRILFFAFFFGAILAQTHADPSFRPRRASNDVIAQICQTTQQSFCLKFLNYDLGVANFTIKGLAQVSIARAESKANATINLIAALWKNASNNPRLKGQYESCLENFKNVIDSLNEAKAALLPGGSGDLSNYASAASSDIDTCGEDFTDEPPQLKKAIQNLQNMISVILAISNHLNV